MHVLPKNEACLCSGMFILCEPYTVRLRSWCGTHTNHMQSPVALGHEIFALRNAAAAARAADDNDFDEVKKSATLLSEQLKSQATLMA
jgi:hypothetical protein